MTGAARRLANITRDHPLSGMKNLDLTDEDAVVFAHQLTDITWNDRFPLSPRIQTLRAILGKLRAEPAREPRPPLKQYEPPRVSAVRRRR